MTHRTLILEISKRKVQVEMWSLLVQLFVWCMFCNVKCNGCIDLAQTCITRFELQYDFPFAFELNCSVVPNCLCYKEMSVVYYEFPPYLEIDKRDNKPKGLIPGNAFHWFLRLFFSWKNFTRIERGYLLRHCSLQLFVFALNVFYESQESSFIRNFASI